MIPDKAIEILEEWGILSANEVDLDLRNAVKLGIEALKHFQYHRDHNIISFVKLLPGETEE